LLNTYGKVVALATSMDQGIPVQVLQEIIP